MSYQLCRWYDPYPRLAFALKLLYLAPGNLQAKVAQELRSFLDEQWGTQHTERLLYETLGKRPGNRWYDEDLETAHTVELIKNSPDTLKTTVADTLLAILSEERVSA